MTTFIVGVLVGGVIVFVACAAYFVYSFKDFMG